MSTGSSASSGSAVALLSGGLDSAVAAAWARAEGHDLVTVAVETVGGDEDEPHDGESG